MNIGAGHFDVMDQTRILVYADVCLLPEVPCVALFRLMRIRIPLLLTVFCGRRCGDNRRIYKRTFLKDQPLDSQEANKLRKKLLL